MTATQACAAAKSTPYNEQKTLACVRCIVSALAMLLFQAYARPMAAAELEPGERIAIEGTLSDPENLSGIAILGDRVFVCGDETSSIDVLTRDGDHFRVREPIPLGNADGEIDLEALASQDNRLYAIGSHSMARKALKDDLSYDENKARLRTVEADPLRDQLVRVKFRDSGELDAVKPVTLRSRLNRHKILGPFTSLPSKENGVDIEGLAVRGARLYVGFRGPVLRGNFVPVGSLEFGDDDENEKLHVDYVTLDGRGIRDLAASRDGFLILAGPVGDGLGGYALYAWDGRDCLPDQGAPRGDCRMLARLKDEESGKPEGMAIACETDAQFELLIVMDGIANTVFRYTLAKRP